MHVELINTGTELLLGSVVNTHLHWLGSELVKMGLPVSRQVAVPDSGPEIRNAVAEAIERSDLIITTGGLGPTSDDVTRDLIAELLNVPLELNGEVRVAIEQFFTIRERPVPKSALKQAMVPSGAVVFPNINGTAPGLALHIHRGTRKIWLIMLPGPPRELQPMFKHHARALLQKNFDVSHFHLRTFKTTGLGETFVEERIATELEELVRAGLDVGYCAKPGQVEVRLSAHTLEAAQIVQKAEKIVCERLNDHIFASTDATLEQVVVDLLIRKQQTLALAESCTGGLVAHRITNVPGASAVFLAGLITYSNIAKEMLLGVHKQTLACHGAVSEQTAHEMAEGARTRHGTDYAVSVTGIAGPDGGSVEKPVGTVFIALATPQKTIVEKNFNPYDRETFKFVTSQQALDLLRRNIRA